jgi:hypothetical protein
MSMGLDDSARKIRRAAERKHVHTGDGDPAETEKHRHHADKDSAEAHAELTHPEHSKGQPLADHGSEDDRGKRRLSNAGK